jgi:CPA2 family monovalent cation:H+ antiporter-2
MHHDVHLTEITLVVVAALAGGLGLARLKQPPILGYILAGILLGPSGFAFVQSREQVGILAELGVLLLLFVIGMELNLRTFKKFWGISTSCTVLQIFGGVSISFLLAQGFGWSSDLALLLGFVVSLSSTAVVVKVLESIGEMKTDSGQITIGVLIAQDLAIVPMILLLKNLDKSWYEPTIYIKLLISIGLIVALISYLSQRQRVRIPLTQIIAGEKDLTPLASLTFCFAAAAISGLIGLSAAYGAFLAGLILGNTHERLIMIETTKPIQSILLMAFFLSIGLLLDLKFIGQNIGTVLILLFIITIGKTALNIGILHALRLPWSQSFLIGVVLAQLGEFAFLLTTVAHESKIVNDYGEKLIIALTVLSLAFSPLWLTTARRLKAIAASRNISFSALLRLIYGEEFTIIRKTCNKVLHLPLLPDHSGKKQEQNNSHDSDNKTDISSGK